VFSLEEEVKKREEAHQTALLQLSVATTAATAFSEVQPSAVDDSPVVPVEIASASDKASAPSRAIDYMEVCGRISQQEEQLRSLAHEKHELLQQIESLQQQLSYAYDNTLNHAASSLHVSGQSSAGLLFDLEQQQQGSHSAQGEWGKKDAMGAHASIVHLWTWLR
jgi:hypothetical protein